MDEILDPTELTQLRALVRSYDKQESKEHKRWEAYMKTSEKRRAMNDTLQKLLYKASCNSSLEEWFSFLKEEGINPEAAKRIIHSSQLNFKGELILPILPTVKTTTVRTHLRRLPGQTRSSYHSVDFSDL